MWYPHLKLEQEEERLDDGVIDDWIPPFVQATLRFCYVWDGICCI
jgi:hypothetical protein